MKDEFNLKHVDLVRMAGSLNAHIEKVVGNAAGKSVE